MLGFSQNRSLLTFSVLSNILMLAAPLHMLQVYDRVLVSGSVHTLFYITLIAALALVLFGVCEAIRSRMAQRLSAAYVVDHAEELFAAGCSGQTGKAQANDMLRNFNTVRMFLASKAYISLYDLPFTPAFLVLLFLIHYQVGLLTLAGTAVLVVIALLNRSAGETERQAAGQANTNAVNFASGIISRAEDIRAMGLMPNLMGRWGAMTGESLNAQERATAKNAFYHGVSRTVRQLLQISIMAWGAFLVLAGDMSGGLIFAASMISSRAVQPVEQVIGGWDNLVRARNSASELDGFFKQAGQSIQPVTQPAPSGRLRLDEVCAEAGDTPILTHISFELQPGEFLGIVGASGSGKSTLARIISGAAEAASGSVALDGCEQKNWPPEQWGDAIGYVSQDLHLFPGTVSENIARMSQTPDDARVVEAARMTGVHDLINSFPEGYMTRIGDGQLRLSGGQIQRIALARALYTRPKLLILDEPNAHLDMQGEVVLYDTLRKLKASGVTIVTISQRGKLNQLADRVLVLKNGKIAAMHVAKPADAKAQAVPNSLRPREPSDASEVA